MSTRQCPCCLWIMEKGDRFTDRMYSIQAKSWSERYTNPLLNYVKRALQYAVCSTSCIQNNCKEWNSLLWVANNTHCICFPYQLNSRCFSSNSLISAISVLAATNSFDVILFITIRLIKKSPIVLTPASA